MFLSSMLQLLWPVTRKKKVTLSKCICLMFNICMRRHISNLNVILETLLHNWQFGIYVTNFTRLPLLLALILLLGIASFEH